MTLPGCAIPNAHVHDTCQRATSGKCRREDDGDDHGRTRRQVRSTKLVFESLPNEIVDHVLDFLDAQAPSCINWNQQPDTTLTRSGHVDLKQISLTSKRLRCLTLPRLFSHAYLDPNKDQALFETFIRSQCLETVVRSLVVHLRSPCHQFPQPRWWSRLLDALPALRTFIILCPPFVLAELAETSIVNMDSWIFNMPYHTVRFGQSPVAHDTTTNVMTHHLLTARPWTSFSLNEGSSLKAYSQYEYFRMRTPSLLGAFNVTKSTIADTVFASLQHFSYTAIFPFFNHVDEILKNVRKMKKLKTLTTKLCPEPESSVIDDEIKACLNHIDINDAWMEFDTSYTLVAHTARYLAVEGQLEELRVDDVKMEGIREQLEETVSEILRSEWAYTASSGIWKRLGDPKKVDSPKPQ